METMSALFIISEKIILLLRGDALHCASTYHRKSLTPLQLIFKKYATTRFYHYIYPSISGHYKKLNNRATLIT